LKQVLDYKAFDELHAVFDELPQSGVVGGVMGKVS
jgi:hypothetical protein